MAAPSSQENRPVGLDLSRPTRERPHGVREFRDLAVSFDREPVSCERVDPLRVCPRREVPLGVDNRLHLHRDSGVEVRPLAVFAENLDVQPQVAVDVRIERARATVLQFDDLDAVE